MASNSRNLPEGPFRGPREACNQERLRFIFHHHWELLWVCMQTNLWVNVLIE
ncbi:hypothetical protein SOVF_185650 isoform B [Spinacia oleracea]|nr:hypothetical protein SOVF_185650 isoform B [Spinacia oleracea]